jgi:hypothetical protein
MSYKIIEQKIGDRHKKIGGHDQKSEILVTRTRFQRIWIMSPNFEGELIVRAHA